MIGVNHAEWQGVVRLLLVLTATMLLAVSCGSSTPASPTPAAHVLPLTVMIMDTGPNPKEVTIAVGAAVAFMNHDTVPHGVAGGSDATRPDCPEINAVGVLMPGEIRSTSPFITVKTCEYHDSRVSAAMFNGRIVIR